MLANFVLNEALIFAYETSPSVTDIVIVTLSMI
jgi:hypothetical protein